MASTVSAEKTKKSRAEDYSKEEFHSAPKSNVWLFVAKEGDKGFGWLDALKIGDVIPWRHGSDSYAKTMKPGDTAVIYLSKSDGKKEIQGIGALVSVRRPFLLDPQQMVHRIPIVFLRDFRRSPLNAADIEKRTGSPFVKGAGSLTPVSVLNIAEINRILAEREEANSGLPMIPLDIEECSRAVSRIDLGQGLTKGMFLLETHITARQLKSGKAALNLEKQMPKHRARELIDAAWKAAGFPPPYLNSDLNSISDNPEIDHKNDVLDRYAMAKILAIRLERIYKNVTTPSKSSGGKKEDADQAPFTVLVDAPWGGGKSTFANFIALQLNDEQQSTTRWNIATFNVWKYQHVQPIWWVVYQSIFQSLFEPKAQMEGDWRQRLRMFLERLTMLPKRLTLKIYEAIWRLRTPGNILWLCSVTIFTAMTIWLVVQNQIEFSDNNDPKATPWLGFLTSAGALAASLKLLANSISKSLLPGTPSSANNYALGGEDPLDRFRKHFHRTLKLTNSPTLLIIDDIDRCEEKTVVNLIEGLQTVLRSPRLIVLILGDRQWVEKCFSNQFGKMSDPNDTSLGRKFVEKALQMTLTLPRPTEQQIGELLNRSIRANPSKQSVSTKAETDNTGQDIVDVLNVEGVNSEVAPTNWDNAIKSVERSNSDERIGHALEPIASFLPGNPRQLKRIINMISFYQTVAEGRGEIRINSDQWKKFAIWIIIMMRFREEWQQLNQDPNLLISLREASSDEINPKVLELLDIDVKKLSDQETHPWANIKIEVSDIKLFRNIIPS